MKIIAPLGPRTGLGTFDTFWDPDKYKTVEDAITAQECVVVNFVEGEGQVIYFELYHIKYPNERRHHKLIIQWFRPELGVDQRDDWAAEEIANGILGIPFIKRHMKDKTIVLPFKKS